MQRPWQKKFFARAQFWANILGKLPGVAAIFLSGSLARGDGNENSDIDFFVITHPGQIWTARFGIFVMLKLGGRLAKPHHHAGQICPNHFISRGNLLIAEQDHYAARLFASNQPLFDPERIFLDFQAANQAWINQKGSAFKTTQLQPKKNVPKKTNPSFLAQKIETWLKKIQIKKIRSNADFHNPNAKIILTDQELRFHPHPKNSSD